MVSTPEKPSICYDVLLLGDSAVGKTSIIKRQCQKEFPMEPTTTIGYGYEPMNVELDGEHFQINLVDTAGQERFHAIIPMLYRKADAFILVYDITQLCSFENLQRWLDRLTYHKRQTNTSDTLVMLLGNKADLGQREVSYEDGNNFAEEGNFKFFEASAKTGRNIAEAFEYLSEQLHAKLPIRMQLSELQSIQLSRPEPQQGMWSKLWSRCRFSSSSSHHVSTNVPTSRSSTRTTRTIATSLEGSRSSVVDSCAAQEHPKLNTDDLQLVRREITALPNWIDVGLELGLAIETLEVIECSHKGNCSDQTMGMLVAWLKLQDNVEARGGPTWQQLAGALRVKNCKRIAKSIEHKYLSR